MKDTHDIFRLLAEDPWACAVAHLGYYTTLRRAEIYYIDRDQDLDFSGRRIILNPKPDVNWYPKEWKDGDAIPWIAMPAPLERFLRAMPVLGPRWLLHPRHTLGSMTGRFSRALKRIKRPGFIHLLRHTSLTHLATSGAPQPWLQGQARHKDPRMTARYAKLGDQAKKDIVSYFPKAKRPKSHVSGHTPQNP